MAIATDSIRNSTLATEAVTALRLDGLLGYEDEEEDVEQKRDREQGDAARTREGAPLHRKHHARPTDTDGDDDAGDLYSGMNEDELDSDEDIDTDQVANAAYTQRVVATLQMYAA